MAQLMYTPEKLRCKKCGKPFTEGKHIEWNCLLNISLCSECLDDTLKHCDQEEKLEQSMMIKHYIMVDKKAHLLAEQTIPADLPDDCYEIRETWYGEKYFAGTIGGDIRTKDIDPDSILLIRGMNGDAIFFMKPEGYPYDFFCDDKTSNYLLYFANFIGRERGYFIVSDENPLNEPRVMGMLNLHVDCDPRAVTADIRLPIEDYEFMAMNGFIENFEARHIDIKLAGILQELTPKVMFEYVSERIRGQDAALKSALFLVYRYLRCIADGREFTADNWMITAPSGSGKTEFYRAIRDLFKKYRINIPVVQIDLSHITESGFKGNNADTIVSRIAAMNKSLGGYAICFLDEADKKFCPSYTSGGNNVNAAIQSNLLTMVEGIEQTVEIGEECVDFDTGRTMFVFMGAFQEIRDKKQRHKTARGMGFGCDLEKKDETADADGIFYEDIDIQDMIDYGMLEELAGRIVRIVSFGRITEEAMTQLIRDKIELIGSEYGCQVRITDKAIAEIVDISYGTIGIRKPINRIKQLVQDTMAEALFGDGFNALSDRVLIEGADKARLVKQTAFVNKKDHRRAKAG